MNSLIVPPVARVVLPCSVNERLRSVLTHRDSKDEPVLPTLCGRCGANSQQTTCADCNDYSTTFVSKRRPRFRGTGVTEHWIGLPHQSALMLRARMTLPHFSVSSAMSLPKSAGETTSGVTPKTASRAFILGSARPALISLLSLSTMSAGVFLGMPTPYELLAS